MSINIGERIRHLRISRKMSQSELVEGICSVAYLSRIENGKTKPSNQFLKKIAERLTISFDMLNIQNQNGFQEEIEKILLKVEDVNRALSKEEKAILKMSLLEFIHPQLLIRVLTTLLMELGEKESRMEADTLYESYIKLIDTNNLEYSNLHEQKIYFRFHRALGKYFYTKQDFNQADYHYSIAETLLIDSNNIESAKLFYNISLVKQRILEDKTVALYYCKKSYEIFHRENDLENVVNVLISMGVQYHLVSNYEKSLKLLKEAKDYLEKLQSKNKPALLTMIIYNMGRVYQKLKDYDQAIFYYNQSSSLTENDIHKVYIFKGLLEIKLKKKEWFDVKNLLDETFTLVNKHKLTYIETELHLIKATVYKERGDYINYEKCIKYAIERAKLEGYPPLIRKMAEELANYYYELRFYKKSSEYYSLALNHS